MVLLGAVVGREQPAALAVVRGDNFLGAPLLSVLSDRRIFVMFVDNLGLGMDFLDGGGAPGAFGH